MMIPTQVHEAPTRHRSARSAVSALRILIMLVVVVGTAECFLAQRRPPEIPVNNVPWPYVMFRPPASTTWRSPAPSPSSRSGEYAVEYTSADAFRVDAPGRDIGRARVPGQIRIAVLGGSTVRVGTTFDVSLAGALRARLRERHPGVDFEVINAGIISAVSRQELVLFITTILDYAPDIVLVYDGINDSGQMLYYEDRPHFPYNFRVMEAAWNRYVEGRTDPLWKLALQRSAILERLSPGRFGERSVLHPIPAQQLIAEPELRRQYADAHVANWSKIHTVAVANRIRSLFVLQPTSLYPMVDDSALDVNRSPVLYANYLVYEEMRGAIRAFARSRPDLRVIDLAALLPADAFYDGAHVWDDVNHVIAEQLAAFMRDDIESLLSPVASRP